MHFSFTTMADYSRPTTPDGQANGTYTPCTPRRTGLALTEYTANPSPPPSSPKPKTQSAVPEAFLLPNGYPDVSSRPSLLPPSLVKVV